MALGPAAWLGLMRKLAGLQWATAAIFGLRPHASW